MENRTLFTPREGASRIPSLKGEPQSTSTSKPARNPLSVDEVNMGPVDYAEIPEQMFRLPDRLKIRDDRDEMHQRGWTWFRITGRLRGKTVSGVGQIPFVNAAVGEHPPWLSLRIDDDRELIDTSQGGALVTKHRGTTAAVSYPSGTFWLGLPRPWTGLHTVDVIRRDAAARRLSFETLPSEDAQCVDIHVTDSRSLLAATYRVNLDRDILQTVELGYEGTSAQQPDMLQFQYIQNLEVLDEKFITPVLPANRTVNNETMGPLWPMILSSQPVDTPSGKETL
jgi:hypothetical protein